MSEARWLEDLARLAREEQQEEKERFDERWDALCAGDLTSEEEAALRALAEGSEEGEAAWEAFRPLESEFQGRVLEAARFQLKPSRGSISQEETTAGRTPALPARRGIRRWWLPSALAAALALFVLWPKGGPGQLPEYALRLEGSVRTERSEQPVAEEGRYLFIAGNRLRLVLTPGTAVEGEVAALAFLATPEGLQPLLEPPLQISASGAVLFEGVVGQQVLLPQGDAALVVVVGRPSALPPAETLRQHLVEQESHEGEGYFAWRVPVRVEE